MKRTSCIYIITALLASISGMAQNYPFGSWTLSSSGQWPTGPGVGYIGNDETFGVSSSYGQISFQIDGGFRQQEAGKVNYFMDKVGLGLTMPSVKLHLLDGAPSGIQGLNASTKFAIDAEGGGFTEFRNSSNNNTFTGLLFTDDNLGGYVAFRNAPDDRLHIGGYGGIQFEVGSDNNVGEKIERMRIDASGNVSIGITSPTAKLEILQNGGGSGQNQGIKVWAGNDYSYFGNTQLSFAWGGSSGTAGYAHAIKTRHNSNSSEGNAFDFYVWQPGDPVNGEGSLNVMTLNGDKVGIGTTSPDQKLTVNGTIHSKEVKVDLNIPAPDYVFEKTYDLLPLPDLEAYVKQNKHLPEVPSAKEMEENGVNLKEMNLLLLKKVEELTLYLIDMKKENEVQQKEINDLKKRTR